MKPRQSVLLLAAFLTAIALSCRESNQNQNPAGPSSPIGGPMSTAFGVTLSPPSSWMAQASRNAAVVNISNVPALSAESDAALASESLFHLRLLRSANPGGQPIEAWLDQYLAQGTGEPAQSRTPASVGGRSAVRIVTVGVGGDMARYFVPMTPDVLEISYRLFNPAFLSNYEAMLASIQFTR